MNKSVDNYKEVLEAIQHVTNQMKPNVRAILFGSRARGDAKRESDWDILLLINKDKLEKEDYDNISYPLFELGWELNEQLNPILYTEKEWQSQSFTPFYHNIKAEGITL